jgi:hypothetical protein
MLSYGYPAVRISARLANCKKLVPAEGLAADGARGGARHAAFLNGKSIIS